MYQPVVLLFSIMTFTISTYERVGRNIQLVHIVILEFPIWDFITTRRTSHSLAVSQWRVVFVLAFYPSTCPVLYLAPFFWLRATPPPTPSRYLFWYDRRRRISEQSSRWRGALYPSWTAAVRPSIPPPPLGPIKHRRPWLLNLKPVHGRARDDDDMLTKNTT